jgi:hypothetical protein
MLKVLEPELRGRSRKAVHDAHLAQWSMVVSAFLSRSPRPADHAEAWVHKPGTPVPTRSVAPGWRMRLKLN